MKIGLVILFGLLSLIGFSQIPDGEMIAVGNLSRDAECVISSLPENITICENESAEFHVAASNFDEITWFSQANMTIPVGYGIQFNTGILTESQSYKLQATCPYHDNQLKSLETSWRGENGKDGVMFSLQVKQKISLQSIDIHMRQGSAKCHVFMLNGDYSPYSGNPAAWTPIFEDVIDGKGKSNPVAINLQAIVLDPGTYGFYVSLETDNLLYYSTGNSVFEDDFLKLGNVKGVTWPFSYLCGDRAFNGRINYAIGNKPQSVRYEITANVIEKPNAPIVSFSGNQFFVNQSGAFVWYQNGAEIQNENQSILYPSVSGAYTVAEKIGQCVGYESNPLHYAEPDIDDAALEAEFYPNPVQNTLFVNISGVSSGLLLIQDIHGKLLHEENLSGKQSHAIDFSNFSSGQYAVSLISEKNQISQTIIKH
jgi:hypothetical protein